MFVCISEGIDTLVQPSFLIINNSIEFQTSKKVLNKNPGEPNTLFIFILDTYTKYI